MLADPTLPSLRSEVCPGVWIDSRRAVWFANERLLAVADLHWGYVASHRARGNLLPLWGDQQLEECLHSLIADYAPAEVIWLGDVVHAVEGAAPAERFLARASVPITILAGNHDRRWRGAITTNVQRGRYFFHHGDVARPVPPNAIEVVGHHHPAFSWADGAGARVKLPALVVTPRRLVLPAFSPWAAGTDWLAEPESALWVIAPKRIFAVRAPQTISAAV
jgi:metallophosphoesterase superfamily enzyme